MVNSFIRWILILKSLLFIINCENCLDGGLEVCPNEETSPLIKWPSQCNPNEELIVSYQHRCLDIYKHYVTRRCTLSGWYPELIDIQCPESIDEYTIRTPCPPGYKTLNGVLDDIQICVQINSEQPWENICLKSGSSLVLEELDLSLTQKVLEQVKNDIGENYRFWLPAKELWYNELVDFEYLTGSVNYSVQWTLAGKYGQNSMARRNSHNGCVLTDYSFLMTRAAAENVVAVCSELYPIICLYNQKEPTMIPISCPLGYKTTRYADYQDVCIQIRKFPVLSDELSDEYVKSHVCENIFYVDSGYALHIFKELSLDEQLTASDRCLFGIVPGRVIITEQEWTYLDMADIPFINWSFNVSISPIDSEQFLENILVAKNNGEWVWDDKSAVTCAICSIPILVYYSPNLNLHYQNDGDLFASVIQLKTVSSLWKEQEFEYGLSCFSLTYISKRIESVSLTYFGKENYIGEIIVRLRYKLSTNGSGRYWCTALQIMSFTVHEYGIMWYDPLKFAILAKNRKPSGTGITTQFADFLMNNLDMNIFRLEKYDLVKSFEHDVHLFHVIISVITDDFLKFEENLLKLNDHMLPAYYIQQSLYNITKLHHEFVILSVNSTKFCLPTTISNMSEINWHGSRIGQYAISNEFCLLHTNGLPATKRCVGDGLYGGTWMESFDEIICNNDIKSNATEDLHELRNLNISPERVTETITHLVEIIGQSNYPILIAADIFYVSQIMQEIMFLAQPLDHNDVTDILGIYNRLLMVDDTVIFSSASALNSTNDLLYAVDVILSNFATHNPQTYDGILSFEFSQPMLSTFIFNSKLTDYTGILVTNQTKSLSFQFINKSRNIDDIINIPDLIIASYIPETLIKILNNSLIIMSFFINDNLFHPATSDTSILPKKYVNASGSIISIILPGSYTNLPQTIPIFIKPDRPIAIDSDDNACGFWDFSDDIYGWATQGCFQNKTLVNATVIICECEHVTHFAYLFYGYTPIDMRYFEKLQTITFIGCSVSLIGFSGIYITAMLFRSFRSTLSTKFLLQISAAITLEMLMILFVNTEANSWILMASDKAFACIVFGATLHYTVLVTFFWMLIIAYLQFKRYVIVFHELQSSKFFLKSSLVGWGVPMLPVILVLLIDRQSYIPTLGYYKICYLSGYALYFALMAPVTVIIIANFIIFILIIKSLKSDNCTARRHLHKGNILSKLRLSIFLFFMFGLTWIFAFLSAIDVAEVGIVFTYLFCAAATLQGFIFFIYFIMLDPVVRGCWIKLLKRMCYK